MLKQTIENLAYNFLLEAKSSPKLFADMAAMERYMSESYCGRAFVELLQNADDCDSSKILIQQFNGDLLFANNGHPFNEKDILSISRSGASSKERGKSIGYRGIGFKSTIYLSNEIIIYSNNTYFTFSKDQCAKILNTDINNVPTIRIPLLIEPNDELRNIVDLIIKNGYTTVFIFKNAKIEKFIEELKSVENDYFLFLNNVCKCKIEIESVHKEIFVKRSNNEFHQLVSFSNDLTYQWLIFRNFQASIGFKYSNEEKAIIACKENEQLYYSYLPTFDKILYPIKINADFSTDPSRKHIMLDDKSEKALYEVSYLLYDIIQRTFDGQNNNELKNIFLLLNKPMGFSRINSILKQNLFNLINDKCYITINKGEKIHISEYKLFPDWFETSEIVFLRKTSKYVIQNSLQLDFYDKFIELDEFIGKYSQTFYTNDEILEMIKETSVIKNLAPETQGKILGKVLKKEKLMQDMGYKELKDYAQIKILSTNGVVSIDELSNSDLRIENAVLDSLKNVLGNEGMKWFIKTLNIKYDDYNNENKDICTDVKKPINDIVTTVKPHITKWRSAEQQCVEIEKIFGNMAVDVSKQNIGYDIESTMPSGEKRFIEVKSIKKDGEFSITNNEYTAAHQYGDNYYLCLMIQDEKKIKAVYINNPLNNLRFEKRIKQWEWVCESYSGKSFEFEY